MTYAEFLEKLKQRTHQELGFPLEKMTFYPEGFTSDNPSTLEWIRDGNVRFVGKESDTLLTDFLMMETDGAESHPHLHRVATKYLYEDALKNGFDAVCQEVLKGQRELEEAKFNPGWMDARSSDDYARIREQLILRPLNYSLHMRDLHGCAYRKVSDFVLALYQLIGDSDKTLVSSKIRREELQKWGMEGREEKVFRDALENTARLFPPSVYNCRTKSEEAFLEKEFSKGDIFQDHRTLLSTFKSTNGAMALFYPGVISKMMKIMGGPFQAVFMNINDVMIFNQRDSLAYRYAQTARQSSGLGEMLSGKVYLCDGEDHIPDLAVRPTKTGSQLWS